MAEHDLDDDMIGTQVSVPMPDIEDEDEAKVQVYGEDSEVERVNLNYRPFHDEDEFEDDDSSSLFIPEGPPVPHSTQRRQDTSAAMPHPASLPTPRQNVSSGSVYTRIIDLQKKRLGQLEATNRPPATLSKNANPSPEALLEPIIRKPPSSTSFSVVDEDSEDILARREFLKQKRIYDELRRKRNGTLLFQEDVEWMRIRGAEEARKRKLARDLPRDLEDTQDDQVEDSDNQSRSSKRLRPNPDNEESLTSMADAELASMRVAMDAQADEPQKKKKKGTTDDDQSQASTPSGRGKGKGKSTGKSTKVKTAPKKVPKRRGGRDSDKKKKQVEQAVKQASSLFNSNVFRQQAGANAAEQPMFKSKVKADALKELIASLPIETNQKSARNDMNTLLIATKDFDGKGSVRSDGRGGWTVKGMKTSLKSYQVLGSAFMRRREIASEEPKGGLMADQMGLGKTLMMLANIVNSQPARREKRKLRTTLLVASPALLMQWRNEIEQHTDCGLRVMRYGSGMRLDSTNALEILADHDVVLTTYTEIMHSYPKNNPPIECQTAEQKIQWWAEEYRTKRGPLHSMQFLRIVLDEAQAIKNHQSRTSIACRALMADHRWALSGTPVLNSLTELYPYFKFLNVPHTGSFKIFKHNYCDIKDPKNTERLLVRLAQFMIRRTHADEMFGAPILKLPQADQTTFWCDFNPVERTVYEIVRQRFAKCINMWAKKKTLGRSYNNAMVMFLRLRQLTSHILMLQFVMRDLLEVEDIELIKQALKEHEKQSRNTRDKNTVIAVRKQLDKLAADQKKKTAALEAKKAKKKAKKDEAQRRGVIYVDDDDSDDQLDDEAEEEIEEGPLQEFESGGSFGRNFNFKPFLGSLQSGKSWEKAKEKAKCSYCEQTPRRPLMPSCGHLICTDCRAEADLDAAAALNDSAACKVCYQVPTYIHECEVGEFGLSNEPSHGTRGNTKKKREKESQLAGSEDISEDWLASLGDDVLPSAKTIAVKSQILNWQQEKGNVKVIVYTQFLAMIRILGRVLDKEGWKYEETQYHGSMSLKKRDDAIGAFANNRGPMILLASLRCGGLGLNLTMASKVIMIDPWWNMASEQQAFCRVFRIGQDEKTFMSRLCVKNTVDARLVEMQEKKQEEIDLVMEEDGRVMKKMDTRALMRLFGDVEEDAEGFILVDNPDARGGFRADADDEGYADEM
ncbi:hypothetical protein GMOD_00007755 [Pyrenophora seminiperda CCB06]|uniref:Dna repair rad5 n=1 Tax=Pyrenophora seminiperda CCB06 TaxID=1302712 RepID=A0A3M7MDZ0_9PLEO|nr:hypothetical protein GMOD_00007755 [Pyrenophora seminiperda CCB06]